MAMASPGAWQAPVWQTGAGALVSVQLPRLKNFRSNRCFLNEAAQSLRVEIVQCVARLKRRQWMALITSALSIALVVSTSSPTYALTKENLLFLEAWRTVDRAFVDESFNRKSWFRYRQQALRNEPMSTREETYAAIRKMLATLGDPFTRFLEPEKFKNLVSGTEGSLTGVGVEVGLETGLSGLQEDLVIVSPIPGGPAARAGVAPGDIILEIDHQKVLGLSPYDAAKLLQGPENSSVVLTVLCRENKKEQTMTLTREKVVVNPVTWKLCEVSSSTSSLKLGYIRLATFNQKSPSAVQEALECLHKSGASAYVLDIRNNGGGYFPAVIEIAKMWLDKGVIVYIADNNGIRDIYETDEGSAIAPSEPLVVLVNKGTASAGEILAGALKDNARGTVLGEHTFGKGKIQSIFELEDGSGLVVTTARYQTPHKIDIDKVGVAPDRPLPVAIPKDSEQFCKCFEGSSECLSSLFSEEQ